MALISAQTFVCMPTIIKNRSPCGVYSNGPTSHTLPPHPSPPCPSLPISSPTQAGTCTGRALLYCTRAPGSLCTVCIFHIVQAEVHHLIAAAPDGTQAQAPPQARSLHQLHCLQSGLCFLCPACLVLPACQPLVSHGRTVLLVLSMLSVAGQSCNMVEQRCLVAQVGMVLLASVHFACKDTCEEGTDVCAYAPE